jgi:hypothetical protein
MSQDSKGKLDILHKLNQAHTTPVSKSTSAAKTYSVSKDATEMLNILQKLETATVKATTEKYQEAKVDIKLSTATMANNTVSVGKYNVVMEKKTVIPGVKKTFYKITDNNGDALYSDIALFESAMGVVKGLLFNNNKVKKILDLDAKYAGYLAETAVYQYKAKTLNESYKKDVAVAKQGNAATKMMAIKNQIKTLL